MPFHGYIRVQFLKLCGEIDLLGHVIPVYQWVCEAIFWIGAGEILFGILLLAAAWRWVFWLNIAALAGLLLFVLLFEPAMFTLPFNPLTLNVSLIALSVIALIEMNTIKIGHQNESAPL